VSNHLLFSRVILITLCSYFFLNISSVLSRELVFCHQKSDPPWVFNHNYGFDIERLKTLEKIIDIPISHRPLPWRRCIDQLENGKVDGIFSVEFQKDLFSKGVYPPDLDPAKGMHDSSFRLYVNKESSTSWDGRLIRNAEKPIGVSPGFSMKQRFELLSVPLDEINSSVWGMFKMLELNRLGGVIISEQTGDKIFTEYPAFNSKIVEHPIPISISPTYLMLSNQLVKSEPLLAQKIWDSLAKIKNTR